MAMVSIRELRAKTKEILDTMHRGQKIVITSHGKPVAELVPYKAKKTDKATEASIDEAFGMWQDFDDTKDVPAYIHRLRKRRKLC